MTVLYYIILGQKILKPKKSFVISEWLKFSTRCVHKIGAIFSLPNIYGDIGIFRDIGTETGEMNHKILFNPVPDEIKKKFK